MHQWHWISSALSLIGLLFFAVTGITLNHAAEIEARPLSSTRQIPLSPELYELLKPPGLSDRQQLEQRLWPWVHEHLGLGFAPELAEWSDDEVYVPLPRPGGDASLRIDRVQGQVDYEVINRGWIAYLNDVHKGRHTGPAWSWFIDLFGMACVIFALTGLLLLHLHGKGRPMTWPAVGMGLLVPLVLLTLLAH